MTNNYSLVVMAAAAIGGVVGFVAGLVSAYFILGDDFQEKCRRCKNQHNLEKRVLSIGLRDRD